MKRSELPIPSPCTENWDTMTREGRRLFCDKCKKHVHDLTQMSEGETRDLLAKRDGAELCVRYLHDAFGNIVFGMVDTTVMPANRLVRSKRAVFAAAAALSVSATMACGGAQQEEPRMLGGAIACPLPSNGETHDPVPVATGQATSAPSVAPPATNAPLPVATTPPVKATAPKPAAK